MLDTNRLLPPTPVGRLYTSARSWVSRLRSHPYLGFLQRAQHRALQQRAVRNDHHTYTCFYRSPLQLEALVGPIADALEQHGRKHVTLEVFAASNGAEAWTIASELLFRRPSLDFTLIGSDLHPETVAQAAEATYSLEEVTRGGNVPRGFIDRTFDPKGDQYVVKPHIRERVTFEQADLLGQSLWRQFPRAELVFAQNVFCHLPPEHARAAFENVLRLLKPHGWLFLDGMDLDLRVELTRLAGLEPLDFKVRDIYRDARAHVPANWWDYYYGSEPYSPFAAQRLRRYCTIFESAAA